jgi:hypothetical protein
MMNLAINSDDGKVRDISSCHFTDAESLYEGNHSLKPKEVYKLFEEILILRFDKKGNPILPDEQLLSNFLSDRDQTLDDLHLVFERRHF